MLNIKNSLLLLCFAVFLAVPNSSEAFKTVDQRAIWLDENTFIYTVAYEFGFLNRELRMPIAAVKGQAFASDNYSVGYSFIMDKYEVNNSYHSSAIVLSGAKVVNGEYVVPKGKRDRFTLVVVGKTDVVTDKADGGIAVKVTSLPLRTVDDEGKLSELKMAEEQLVDYITPTLTKKSK